MRCKHLGRADTISRGVSQKLNAEIRVPRQGLIVPEGPWHASRLRGSHGRGRKPGYSAVPRNSEACYGPCVVLLPK